MCVFSVCVSLFIYILYIIIGQSVKLDVVFFVFNKVCPAFVIFFFFVFLYHRIATALRVFLSPQPQATCQSLPQCPQALLASPHFMEMKVIALAAQAGQRLHQAL